MVKAKQSPYSKKITSSADKKVSNELETSGENSAEHGLAHRVFPGRATMNV